MISRELQPRSTAEKKRFSSTAVHAIHQRRRYACSSVGAIPVASLPGHRGLSQAPSGPREALFIVGALEIPLEPARYEGTPFTVAPIASWASQRVPLGWLWAHGQRRRSWGPPCPLVTIRDRKVLSARHGLLARLQASPPRPRQAVPGSGRPNPRFPESPEVSQGQGAL